MMIIRSLLFNVFFFVWTALVMMISLFLLVFPKEVLIAFFKMWAEGISLALRVLVNIKYEVRGAENIIDGPVIYASKHQSVWETFMFYSLVDSPVYIMKKELLKIPFWGWYVRKVKSISIDRTGGSAALKGMVADTNARLTENRPVVIFPEGTRTSAGSHLPFHPGVAALYSMTEATVVPVALNTGLFWGRHVFTKNSGTIVVEFLQPIKQGLKRKEFMTKLVETVNTASDRLADEGVADFPKTAHMLRRQVESEVGEEPA